VSVTLLFFVHLPQGSFQACNGPTTPVNRLGVALACILLLLAAQAFKQSPKGNVIISRMVALKSYDCDFSPQLRTMRC
jgi:hypothetical protein